MYVVDDGFECSVCCVVFGYLYYVDFGGEFSMFVMKCFLYEVFDLIVCYGFVYFVGNGDV